MLGPATQVATSARATSYPATVPDPTPEHPHYCPGSRQLADAREPGEVWVRCPMCHRLIAPMRNELLHPHLDHPTRKRDMVQELLSAIGWRRRLPEAPAHCGDE